MASMITNYGSRPTGGMADGLTIGGDGSVADPFSVITPNPAQWFVDQFNFVKAKVPGVSWQMPYSSECQDLNGISLNAQGANSAATELSQARSGGWWRFATGTTTGSARVGSQKDAAGVRFETFTTNTSARLVSNSRTKPWATATRVVIVSLPGGTNANDALYPCNFLDQTNDTGLHIKGATSQVNWAFGVGGVWTNTGVPVVTGVECDLVVINDTTNVKGYLDGVEIGSAASSGLATASGYLRWYVFNVATVNHEFQMDKVMGMTAIETT